MVERNSAGSQAPDAENPFSYFDAVCCINLDSATERWRGMCRRFELLGILPRVLRFAAVATPQSHHLGCALSHRAIIEQADRQGLRNVLVFEDDALFLEDTLKLLKNSVAELAAQDWSLFHLGGHTWGQSFPVAPGCSHLRAPCRELTCTHAVAYHQTVYRTILDELPADLEGMHGWLAGHRGIDQYLRSIPRRFLSRPSIASQRFLLDQEEVDLRGRYILGEVPRRNESWEVDPAEARLALRHRATGEVLALNATAAIVLDLVDGERTTASIRNALQTAWPDRAAVIARDLELLLTDLSRRGVLSRW